jgi:hypothetical protein
MIIFLCYQIIEQKSNEAEKIKFDDNLYPIDILAYDGIFYTLGISNYKLKLVAKNNNGWNQVQLPGRINSDFINKTVEQYTKHHKEDPGFSEKYDGYNENDPDNFHKEFNLRKILTDKIFLNKDKSLILITGDSIYYRVNEDWIPRRIREIEGFLGNDDSKIAQINIIKDSILYYGQNNGEWDGFCACLDFREQNPEWKYFLSDNISGLILDSAFGSFWYSTSLKHMGLIKGTLSYFKEEKNKILVDFSNDEQIKNKFNMKQGTVVRQIEKINDNIIMLTEAGLYIYKNNFVNKLLDDFGEFKIFKIDSKGNIYIDTKKRGFLKCTPVNENYKMSKISFPDE